MKRIEIKVLAAAIALAVSAGNLAAATPTGAKAIFDSGEGSSIAMSAAAPRPAAPVAAPIAPAPEKFVGISYQIMALSDDGQMRAVSKSRIFRSGERARIIVRTNRPGYLTVMNIGPTGNTAVLFNEFVEPFRMVEVPRNSNLRFVGDPGTERVLFMLSNEPNPLATQVNNAPAPAPIPSTAYAPAPAPNTAYASPPVATPSYAPPPGPVAGAENLPPSPPAMVASIDGAKSLKGAKDLVAEDSMQSTYTVVSPGSGWKPKQAGMKDLVVESQGGVNYGVLPVSALSGGGILTLEIKLAHR